MTAMYHVTPQIIDNQALASVLHHSDGDRLKNCDQVKELPQFFTGKGEVSGFEFYQIGKSPAGYLYKVVQPSGLVHYEVFHRIQNERFRCVSYPGSKSFGLLAWTFKTFDEARNRLMTLSNEK